ncbi:hypothetical protein BU25DRAFT_460399 [Macroventuria anomochaeta]|uniref:Uncharacterized protein n=1 Tax=Macroventuria anomochaeta TaxID=301207 RepID=A0ACB6RU26_9PLEO|nr:uncharacterized protein BU25DRAFT_460399 [Macroventuria anomochaeta]KAF2625279.1 hypothetical protein BU25DRAFT_460399 [Macroventuria anomochaeta]
MTAKVLPPSVFPTAAPMHSPPQVIENRYIDDDKLVEICKERFGAGNYRLKFKLRKWYLSAPCWLDDETIEQCEMEYL